MKAFSKQIGAAGMGRLAGVAKIDRVMGRGALSAVAKECSLESQNYA